MEVRHKGEVDAVLVGARGRIRLDAPYFPRFVVW